MTLSSSSLAFLTKVFRPVSLRAFPSRRRTLFLAVAVATVAVTAKFPPTALAAPDEAPKLAWKMLRGLDYKTGQTSDEVKAVAGKVVEIPGYMVPLEDESDTVTEFLLVPYAGACIHTPTPPPNQIVYVKMTGGKKVKVSSDDAVWVKGRLDIATVTNFYGDASYTVVGTDVAPYSAGQ